MTAETLADLAKLVGSKPLAERLLSETTLRHLAAAPLSELHALMPKRAAERVHAALRVARAAVTPESPPTINTAFDAHRALAPYFDGRETERMVVIVLNARNRPVALEVVAEGAPSEVSVHIGSLFAPAVRHRSTAIVMAHNHPSTDPTPSDEDVRITERAVAAGVILGIVVLDHLIVGGERYVSLREMNESPFARERSAFADD